MSITRTLGQTSSLVDALLKNYNLQEHFILNPEEVYDAISNISDAQYALILSLLAQKQYRPNRPGGANLNDIMKQLGFKIKK